MSILTRPTLFSQHVTLTRLGRRGLSRTFRAHCERLHTAQCRTHGRRISSLSGPAGRRYEAIDLPVGVSGNVRLDMLSPMQQEQRPQGPRNILLYLPPGPSILPPPGGDALSTVGNILPTSTSLVRINYRLGTDVDVKDTTNDSHPHCFPIPTHDVSTAFDFLTSSTSPFNEGQDTPPRICLLGSQIGGALATMLALTEPSHVHALAAIEPMVDWTGLDEVAEQLRAARSSSSSSVLSTPRKRQRQKGSARYGTDNDSVLGAVEELIKLRRRLFKTPSAYFDPFASPLLFLRAPGRDTPLGSSMKDDVASEFGLDEAEDEVQGVDIGPESSGPYDEDTPSRSSTTSASPSPSTSVDSSSEVLGTAESRTASAIQSLLQPTRPARRRKVLRRWPSIGLPESATLPYTTVFLAPPAPAPIATSATDSSPRIDLARGHTALMRAQGTDLVEMMRRACFYGRDRSFAEEVAQLRVLEEGSREEEKMYMYMFEQATKWIVDMFDRE